MNVYKMWIIYIYRERDFSLTLSLSRSLSLSLSLSLSPSLPPLSGGRAARRGAPWGGTPAGGPGRIDWGRDTPKRLYKAPTNYTKPQNIIQRSNILDKTFQKTLNPKNIRQHQKY